MGSSINKTQSLVLFSVPQTDAIFRRYQH